MGTHPIFESNFDCLTDLIYMAQEVPVIKQKTGRGKWSFSAGSRVMVQTANYNVEYGLALEGPSRTKNANRYLILLDCGIIRYYERVLVSEIRFTITGEEIRDSMSSLSGIKSDTRASLYAQWFIQRLSNEKTVFFIGNKRANNDELVPLTIIKEGKSVDCMGLLLETDCSMAKLKLIEFDRCLWLYKGDPSFAVVNDRMRKTCKWIESPLLSVDFEQLSLLDQSSITDKGLTATKPRKGQTIVNRRNPIELAAIDRVKHQSSSSSSLSSSSSDEDDESEEESDAPPDAPLTAAQWSSLRQQNVHCVELF